MTHRSPLEAGESDCSGDLELLELAALGVVYHLPQYSTRQVLVLEGQL